MDTSEPYSHIVVAAPSWNLVKGTSCMCTWRVGGGMLSIWLLFRGVWFTMPSVPSNGSLMRIIWQLPPRLFFARRRISLCSHCFKILMREIDIKKSYAWLNIFYFLHIIYHFVHFINFGLKILFILTNEI